jgi:hypothetical protein
VQLGQLVGVEDLAGQFEHRLMCLLSSIGNFRLSAGSFGVVLGRDWLGFGQRLSLFDRKLVGLDLRRPPRLHLLCHRDNLVIFHFGRLVRLFLLRFLRELCKLDLLFRAPVFFSSCTFRLRVELRIIRALLVLVFLGLLCV